MNGPCSGRLVRSALDGDVSDRPLRVERLVSGEGRPPDPVDAQDFVTVLSSLLTQNTSLRLPGLSPRTLVVGSGQDLFYPEAALRDLAEAIPRSTLILLSEGRLGSPEQHARELQDNVLDFLLGRAPDQPGTTNVGSSPRPGSGGVDV